mmetsp:Transcript_20557/g.39654  ORF Transcript_20557/g.39654 Transcript_20557/m.39654 type:complete len:1335 (-) Transcript_20557:296-4300(-)
MERPRGPTRFPILSKEHYKAKPGKRRLFDYFAVISISHSKILRAWKRRRGDEESNTEDADDVPSHHAGIQIETKTKKAESDIPSPFPSQPPFDGEISSDIKAILKVVKPKIQFRCPVHDYSDYELSPGVTSFALPHGFQFNDGTESSPKCYSFVLTNVDGNKQFGSCLKFHETLHLGEEDGEEITIGVPKILMIVSHHSYFNQMEELLKLFYRMSLCRRHPIDLERIIWMIVRELPLPVRPNNLLEFRMHNTLIPFEGSALHEGLPVLNSKFGLLFEVLSHDHIVAVFTLLLQEHKLVLVCSCYTVLTHVAESLKALLYPLKWQSVYIPVLPKAAKNVLMAPVPFFLGLNPSTFGDLDESLGPDVAVMNIDKGVLTLPRPAPRALPTKHHNRIMNALLIHNPHASQTRESANFLKKLRGFDDAFPMGTENIRLDQPMPSPVKTTKHEARRLLTIRLEFYKVITEFFRGFDRYIVAPVNGAKKPGNALFKDTAFVRSRPSAMRPLMSQIVQTMAFGEFVQFAIENPNHHRIIGFGLTEKKSNSRASIMALNSWGKLWAGQESGDAASSYATVESPLNDDDWFVVRYPPCEDHLKRNRKRADYRVKNPNTVMFPNLDKTKLFGAEKVIEFSKNGPMGFAFLYNRVQLVHPGSPAEARGVRVGWIIMSIDGRQAPTDQSDLMMLIVHRRKRHPDKNLRISFATDTEIGEGKTEFGSGRIMAVTNEEGIATLRLSFGIAHMHYSKIHVDFKDSGLELEFAPKSKKNLPIPRRSRGRSQDTKGLISVNSSSTLPRLVNKTVKHRSLVDLQVAESIRDRLGGSPSRSTVSVENGATPSSDRAQAGVQQLGSPVCRELKIAFGPGRLGFSLTGFKVSKVHAATQALYKGVEEGMILVSVNGRSTINDADENWAMINAIRNDKASTELVLKFLKADKDQKRTIKRGRSQDSLIARGVSARRHSTDTLEISGKNAYLPYIKTVAMEALKTQQRSSAASHSRSRNHTVSHAPSRPALVVSSDDELDSFLSPLEGSLLEEDFPTDGSRMSSYAMSGRKLERESEFGLAHDEVFIVVHPRGVQMTKELSDTSPLVMVLPQGTKVKAEGKIGRRVKIEYKGLSGWVSQYSVDALPLMISTQTTTTTSSNNSRTSRSGNKSPESKNGPPSVPARSVSKAGSFSENRKNGPKWVKWFKQKMSNNKHQYKIGDRVRVKRKTKKLQCGQVGIICHNDNDKNGNWFVDFIMMDDEVERWSLPGSLIEPVEERVDQMLVVQFRSDQKIGMAFNENSMVTAVHNNSQASAKGVERGNYILRVNGKKPKKGEVLNVFKDITREAGMPTVVEFLLE